jgi:hypothetical protein
MQSKSHSALTPWSADDLSKRLRIFFRVFRLHAERGKACAHCRFPDQPIVWTKSRQTYRRSFPRRSSSRLLGASSYSATKQIGLKPATCRQYGWVCGNVSIRLDTLDFKHHLLVAMFGLSQQYQAQK